MADHDQKPEGQRVYISAEETMTDVRERLVKLTDGDIILVVPPQTQLRHAIAWKVLARWAQEQGKEIAVASSDKQIRALARSVHFTLIPAVLPSEQRPRTVQRVQREHGQEQEERSKKRGRAS